MNFGLSDKELSILRSIFSAHLSSGIVIVYGSRAKGTHGRRSDIDLVIKDSTVPDDNILHKIVDEIDESDFPYLVDLQYYEKIKNPALVQHIDRVGEVIYQK